MSLSLNEDCYSLVLVGKYALMEYVYKPDLVYSAKLKCTAYSCYQ
jgi:hypothetical protein